MKVIAATIFDKENEHIAIIEHENGTYEKIEEMKNV